MKRSDSTFLKPWLKQLAQFRLRLFLGVALAVATGLLGLGLLSLSGWFITAAALYLSLDIYTPGAGIRFFAVGRTVSRYLERLINHDLVLHLQARWRVAYYRHLQQQPLAQLLQLGVSKSVQRLTRNLEAMDNLLLRLLNPLWVFIGVTLVLTVLWAWYAPELLWLLLMGSVAVLCCSARLAWQTRALAVRQLRATTKLRRDAMQLAEAAAELIAWGVYEEHQQRLLSAAEKLEATEVKQQRLQQRSSFVVELVGQLLVVATILVTLASFSMGKIESAVAVMLVLSAMAWQEIALELPQQWANYGNTLAAARDLLKRPATAEVEADVATVTDNPAEVSVQLKQVKVERQQRVLVTGFTQTLAPGGVYWLAGRSGFGKSTFADALLGLHPLAAGSITHNGGTQPLAALSGYLTQATEILDASIVDNLNPQQQPLSDADYWRALEWVELRTVVEALPQQLATTIGPRGVALSGGQLRRIALARVLLQNRPLMVLDEPFSGLDYALAGRILQRLLALWPEKTWLIISHVPAQQLLADKTTAVTPLRLD